MTEGAATRDVVYASPSLIVLAGPPASGKSTWARANFPDAVVSSDDLRALVGAGAHDMAATPAANDLLDSIVAERLRRGLTTVIDTQASDAEARRRWRNLASSAGVEVHAVVFDTAAAACRERNRTRELRVRDDVMRTALRRWPTTRDEVLAEPFASHATYTIESPLRARTAASDIAAATRESTPATGQDRVGLRFGLHLGRFDWAATASDGAPLTEIARAAEDAGFESIWVMDHFRQIPQVGRAWEPMLEAWSTLAYLAACTEHVRLGSLVTCASHRNVGLLAKAAATTDVLSGGRLVCGLGAGWFDQEQKAYGYPPLTRGERLDVLEDALEVLPLLWGKGSPSYEGRRISVPEAMAYPRPVQDPLPMLVGGNGERRTLALAARHAAACNVIGDLATVRRKLAVLDQHCDAVGRARDSIDEPCCRTPSSPPTPESSRRWSIGSDPRGSTPNVLPVPPGRAPSTTKSRATGRWPRPASTPSSSPPTT